MQLNKRHVQVALMAHRCAARQDEESAGTAPADSSPEGAPQAHKNMPIALFNFIFLGGMGANKLIHAARHCPREAWIVDIHVQRMHLDVLL